MFTIKGKFADGSTVSFTSQQPGFLDALKDFGQNLATTAGERAQTVERLSFKSKPIKAAALVITAPTEAKPKKQPKAAKK